MDQTEIQAQLSNLKLRLEEIEKAIRAREQAMISYHAYDLDQERRELVQLRNEKTKLRSRLATPE